MAKKKDAAENLTLMMQSLGEHNLRNADNGYTADCPVCIQEGDNKGKGKLRLGNDGSIACMRFAGHDEVMRRKHREEILEALGVHQLKRFKNFDLSNGYTLRVSTKMERSKNQVLLLKDSTALFVDTVKLDRKTDRDRFIKATMETLQYQPKAPDREDIEKILLDLGSAAVMEAAEPNVAETSYLGFFQLGDGRIGEMTKKGFAVYDPVNGETETVQVLEYGGITYMPPKDTIFYMPFDEGIQLPEDVVEYGDTKSLMKEIEGYLHRYVDMSPFDYKIAATYALFTYLADRTYELPYYRIVGATGTMSRGSGKSRLTNVLARICYRPFKVTDPSAASTYRIMDKFHPTLAIDEFNFAQGGDDAAQLMKILNTGFQRGSVITRSVKDESTNEMVVVGFSPYGPKIIGGLTTSDSNAFESRCLRTEMKKTSRRDIEFRTSKTQLEEATKIRGMLTLWRLRNYEMDLEGRLAAAEEILKTYAIEPRYIQIATPLYAMLDDEELKEELAQMLVERTEDDAQERKLSFEGYLVSVIYNRLFENRNGEIIWINRAVCREDEACDLLTVKGITNDYNLVNNDEKPITAVAVGRKLNKMMFRTHTIERIHSTEYRKAAVVFSLQTLFYHFQQYQLAVPDDFVVPSDSERVERIVQRKPSTFNSDGTQGEEMPQNDALADSWNRWVDADNDDEEDNEYPEPPKTWAVLRKEFPDMKIAATKKGLKALKENIRNDDIEAINRQFTREDGFFNLEARNEYLEAFGGSHLIKTERRTKKTTKGQISLGGKPLRTKELKMSHRDKKSSVLSLGKSKTATPSVRMKSKPQHIVVAKNKPQLKIAKPEKTAAKIKKAYKPDIFKKGMFSK